MSENQNLSPDQFGLWARKGAPDYYLEGMSPTHGWFAMETESRREQRRQMKAVGVSRWDRASRKLPKKDR